MMTHRFKPFYNRLRARMLLNVLNNKVEQFIDLEIPKDTDKLCSNWREHFLLQDWLEGKTGGSAGRPRLGDLMQTHLR